MEAFMLWKPCQKALRFPTRVIPPCVIWEVQPTSWLQRHRLTPCQSLSLHV